VIEWLGGQWYPRAVDAGPNPIPIRCILCPSVARPIPICLYVRCMYYDFFSSIINESLSSEKASASKKTQINTNISIVKYVSRAYLTSTMNQKEYMRYNFEEGLYKAYDSRNPLSTVLSPPGTS
jgi:hypothetical protein